MNNKLMISIIDDSGSRQFSIHRLVQKIALFVAVGMVSIVVLYAILAYFLLGELEVILQNNVQTRENFQIVYEKNSELMRDIDEKTNELLKIGSKVNQLESIVNVHKRDNESSNSQNIDLDSLSEAQKDIILKIVPNGNPLEKFAQKTMSSQQAGCAYVLDEITPIYATANGIIDSVRVAGTNNQFVQIQHSYGFTSSYGHLGKVLVNKGDFVTKGQLIGYSNEKNHIYYNVRFLDANLVALHYTEWSMDNFNDIIVANNGIDWGSLVWALNDIVALKNYRVSYQNDIPTKHPAYQ